MRAIVKLGDQVRVEERPTPELRAADDVLVQVRCAGLCRSDQYIARGWLPSRAPVILGHEVAGVVAEVGGGVHDLAVGDHVTLDPWFPLPESANAHVNLDAVADTKIDARNEAMFGAQRDGAFAEYLLAPRRQLHRVPAALSWQRAAFVEPIAAALCVAQDPVVQATGHRPRAVIAGSGRIAQLTQRILAHRGITVPCVPLSPASCHGNVADLPSLAALVSSSLDWVVETEPSAEVLAQLIEALRVGGTLLLKSRPFAAVPLDLRTIVLRRLVLRGVDYAPFADAIALACDPTLDLESLFAPPWPVETFLSALLDDGASSHEPPLHETASNTTHAAHEPSMSARVAAVGESRKVFLTWHHLASGGG